MKVSFVRGSEEDGAKFWLRRVGWEASEVAERISVENDPGETGYVTDVGGAHGREALWFAEQGFDSILVEPNKYSLRLARERARNKRLSVNLIRAALPYLPLCSEKIEIVDLYWALHQVPDEQKLDSLKEIHRILKPNGSLYSASFGYWEDQSMPSSIHPIAKKETFLKLHNSAGFKPLTEIEKRSDSVMAHEKYWYGKFQKI